VALKPRVEKEPLHLLLLRALVYAAAVFFFLGQLTAWPVTLTAMVAALAALIVGRGLAATPLRTPVLLVAAVGCVLLGVGVQAALGNAPQAAAVLGIRTTLILTEAALFGLGAFGVVLALRVLAARWAALAFLEVAFVALAVVQLFAGHRDYQLGQPRFFSDWAFSNGYDPVILLRIVGVATFVGLGLLLLPKRRMAWTLSALGMLALLCVLGGWLVVLAGGWADDGGQGPAPPASHDPLDPRDHPPDPHDPTPVALVTFHDDFEPVDQVYHLRERTYSLLRGAQMLPSPLDQSAPDVPQAFPQQPTPVGGERLPDWMSREVDMTVALLGRDPAPLCFVEPDFLAPMENPDPSSFRIVYECKSRVLIPNAKPPQMAEPVVAAFLGATLPRPLSALPVAWLTAWPGDAEEVHPYQVLARLQAGDPAWSDAEREQYLQPPADPRYLEFSNQIIADAIADGRLDKSLQESPFARALVLMDWIKKNTYYTRRPGNGDLPDPTADFLFGSRKGFCVHVSYAMAFMLRAQGVPARIAGGYAQNEEDGSSASSILFTEGDAHAWCEIYLRGAGWTPIDGSPEKTIDPPPPHLDPVLKQHLTDKLNEDAPPPTGKKLLEQVLDFLQRWLLLGLAAAAATLLAVLYSVKIWRRLAPALAPAGQLYRVCFRAVLDRLAEVGVRRRFGETREEFALRLPVLGPEFAELSAGHVRQAVSGRDTFDRARWNSLKTQVEARIAGMSSLIRRLCGVLNPVSWMWAR